MILIAMLIDDEAEAKLGSPMLSPNELYAEFMEDFSPEERTNVQLKVLTAAEAVAAFTGLSTELATEGTAEA